MIIDRVDEEFLLFSLRRDGRWVSRWEGAVNAGVAGAWLLELVVEGRLKVIGGKIIPRGKSRMDDPVLDSVLDQIRAARRPRHVGLWVARLSRSPRRRMVQVMHRLQERGYVDRIEGRGAFGKRPRFPQRSPGSRQHIRDYLVEVLLGKAIPNEETIALLGVLDAAGMSRFVFGKNAVAAHHAIEKLMVGHDRIAAVVHAVRHRRLRRFLPFA